MAVSDVKIWTGSEWASLKGPRGPGAYVSVTEPVAGETGELWIDPALGSIPRYWYGSKWRPIIQKPTLPQLNPPGMARLVTVKDSGTFRMRVRTNTGYAAASWWDGSVEVFGAGIAGDQIVVEKAIPATGNWMKSAPKEVFIWSCTAGDATQSGDLDILAADGPQMLTSVDATGLSQLTDLSFRDNLLTSMDVSGCTNLLQLEVSINQLTSLDVSGCKSMTLLQCFQNQLTSLDVSDCKDLESLLCSENSLTLLDARGCTALQVLDCSSNQLTSLDVSDCTQMTSLGCHNNALTSLRAVGVPGYATYGTWASTYSGYRGRGVQAMNNLLDAAALNQLYADLADNTATGRYSLAAVFGNPGIASDDPSIATAKNWIVLGS